MQHLFLYVYSTEKKVLLVHPHCNIRILALNLNVFLSFEAKWKQQL